LNYDKDEKMKYYKNTNNEIFAYEADGSQDEFIGDKVELSVQEIEAHLNPPLSPQQVQAEAKQAKELALNSITVTTTSGKVFDGKDLDQQRMMSAIMSADVVGITETYWKLADNSVAMVTLDELKEALALSIQALGVIIMMEVVV
jgi:hypothetical protein